MIALSINNIQHLFVGKDTSHYDAIMPISDLNE